MIDSTLKIFSWNCRSLYNKLSQFKFHIYKNKPHIICLTETWLTDAREPQLINYSPYYKHRQTTTGGGLAIFVRNDIMCIPKALEEYEDGKLEIQAITIISKDKSIDIMNIYNPNENVSREEFMFYFDQLSNNNVISGDFNGHHSLWDDRQNENTTGKNLADVLTDSNNISLLTPKNFPTHYYVQNNTYSTLDLILCSPNFLHISDISIGEDLDSDHYPVLLEIAIELQVYSGKRRVKWLFEEDQWCSFRSNLPKIENYISLEEKYNFMINSIVETGKKVFKLSKEKYNVKFSKPWWNSECERLIKEKHKAKNTFKKHPTMANYDIYKEKEKIAAKIIKTSKENSFKKFCDEINSYTPTKVIWNKIAALSKKYKPMKPIPLNISNNFITNPISKANEIAKNYEKTFNVICNSDISTQVLIPITMALIDETENEYNCKITKKELLNAVAHLKPTCPGEDLIHNKFLKNLSDEYFDLLLDIFNSSFSTGEIPTSWKSSLILPIPKPDKDLMLPDSYRPISLLPCIPKLLEKIITKRLNFYLECNQKLSPNQNGFRKRLSTMDQIAKLENTIRSTYIDKNICLVIFVDLSKAYDTVWNAGLLYKLQKCGVKGKMLKWIHEYLSGRNFKVFFEGEYSSDKQISSGVPQGSTLSPTLFNVMIGDIPKSPGIIISEYADDITFYCHGKNFNELKALAQKQMDELFKWTVDWGLKINPLKTKAMLFTNKRLGDPTRINLNGEPIAYVKTYKYLGIIFDAPNLKWKNHVDHIRYSSLNRTNILKVISGKQWGADRNILIRLYKSLIRSRFDYGSIFYGTASHSIIKKLDGIQNQCIRLAIGAQKTSPILSLEAESNIPPLAIHRKLLLLKHYCKFTELPDTISCSKSIKDSLQYLSSKNWSSSKIPPFSIRARKQFESLNINIYPFAHVPLISPIPPWFDLDSICKTKFSDSPVAKLSTTVAAQIFCSLREDLNPEVEIFTDGSKIFSPEISCSAGLVVMLKNSTLMKNYKLPPEMEIMGCELFAIKQALTYVYENLYNQDTTNVVIYTDSLSSIQTIKNLCPQNYINCVFSIHEMLKLFNNKMKIVIQFVPGHKDIKGNEMADLAANGAHANAEIVDAPLSQSEKVRTIQKAVLNLWQTHWLNMVQINQKEKHLTTIKNKLNIGCE